MLKKIFLIISFFLLPLSNGFAEEIIKVQGKVIFGSYKNGHISIIVRREREAPSIFSKRIPKPGNYTIDLPKNFGPIYISAANLQRGAKEITKMDPQGEYSGNPIYIGDNGIIGVNIEITQPKEEHRLMDTYIGQTINVSGKVIFDQYKEGTINIFVRSENLKGHKGHADITVLKLPNPGEYTLKIPKDYGKINIGAVNIVKGKVSSESNYVNNPVEIGASDVKNINIYMK